MRNAIVEDEIIGIPVLQAIGLPTDAIVQDEVVVRPFQPLADSSGETEDFHHLVVAQDAYREVGVGLAGIIGLDVQGSRLLLG